MHTDVYFMAVAGNAAVCATGIAGAIGTPLAVGVVSLVAMALLLVVFVLLLRDER